VGVVASGRTPRQSTSGFSPLGTKRLRGQDVMLGPSALPAQSPLTTNVPGLITSVCLGGVTLPTTGTGRLHWEGAWPGWV
jgi:hypothetical protein